MKNYIKLFENFQKENVLVAIYENTMNDMISKGISLDFISGCRLNEEKEWEDENDEYSSGEMRAHSRGLQVMTKPQMAAIYLLAKGRCQDVGADYVKMIDGIEAFGYTDETDGTFNITVPALADAIGMDSDRTLSYTLKKFENLIDGIGETASQSLSQKLIDANDALSQMNDVTIANIASEAIQDVSYTKNRDAADTRKSVASEKSAQRRADLKKENEKIGTAIHELVKAFQAQRKSPDQYSKIIFSLLSRDYPGLSKGRMYDAYAKWLSQRDMRVANYILKPMVA